MNLFGSPPFVCLEREREGGKERESKSDSNIIYSGRIIIEYLF